MRQDEQVTHRVGLHGTCKFLSSLRNGEEVCLTSGVGCKILKICAVKIFIHSNNELIKIIFLTCLKAAQNSQVHNSAAMNVWYVVEIKDLRRLISL